jgi:quercetin dioxygenase-like cupin family protein
MFRKSILVLGLLVATPTLAGDEVTHPAAGDIGWLPTPFGVEAYPVYGNFAEGRHVTFVRFKAGQATPLHTHSHDYTGIIVTGTGRHFQPDRPETMVDLPAGSIWTMPADVPHVSECLPGADCVFALIQDEPFDFTEVH